MTSVVIAVVLGVGVGGLAAALLLRGVRGAAPSTGAWRDQTRSLQASLTEVTRLVRDLERERGRSLGALESELDRAGRATRELAAKTDELSRTLANPTARGAWGERLAEDVLRAAGFVEGIHYRRQTAVADGRTIPDLTFLLPDGRLLHLDVKFPLDNYQRALDADEGPMRDVHLAAFTKDVRARVREVASRRYVDPANGTLGFALLFVPNESLYAAVHRADAALIDEALQRNVVLCSPLTLYAVLAVVRQAIDAFALERRSDELLHHLGRFEREWEHFTGQLDTFAARLVAAQRAFDDLNGPRRRQLERPLQAIGGLRGDRRDDLAS